MIRLPSILLVSVLAVASVPAGAQSRPGVSVAPPSAQLQAAGSEIVFVTRQMGVPVEGKFGRFSAQIALDPRKPETGSVALSIDTGSARFGSAETDREVPKPEWLGVARFPQATFQSTAIKAVGPGRFEVSGKLTIKGQVREVTVPVTVAQSGGTSAATGSFTIKRLEFKVGEGEWADTSIVANDVQVRFKLQIAGLPPV
jgi:polyisoprenoid-binding protein YceI